MLAARPRVASARRRARRRRHDRDRAPLDGDAEWAFLDREADDPELHRDDPELVFRISGRLRAIWETSLVPIAVVLA